MRGNDRWLAEFRGRGLPDFEASTLREYCIHRGRGVGNTRFPKYGLVGRPSRQSNRNFPRIESPLECVYWNGQPLPCLRFACCLVRNSIIPLRASAAKRDSAKKGTSPIFKVVDIRQDVPDFLAYIRERVAEHVENSKGSQQPELVTRVDFGFEFGQANEFQRPFHVRKLRIGRGE